MRLEMGGREKREVRDGRAQKAVTGGLLKNAGGEKILGTGFVFLAENDPVPEFFATLRMYVAKLDREVVIQQPRIRFFISAAVIVLFAFALCYMCLNIRVVKHWAAGGFAGPGIFGRILCFSRKARISLYFPCLRRAAGRGVLRSGVSAFVCLVFLCALKTPRRARPGAHSQGGHP